MCTSANCNMSELHRHKIRLSDGQKRKMKTAYKKRRTVVIGLSHENISGGGSDHIMLTEQQHKAVSKAVKNKTGIRLALSYDQLMKNKEGGLLKEMMNFIEDDVPGGKRFISPLVRKNIAPLLRERFIPWLKDLIDNELDSIITKDPKGSGLKRCINVKLDSLLYKK